MTFTYETQVEPTYDADAEKWTFNVGLRRSGRSMCVPVFSEKTGTILCLIVSDSRGLEGNLSVRMPPAVASVSDGKLRLLVTGKIAPPFIWQAGATNTLDSYAGIHFEIAEVACVNPKTGQQWKVEYEATPLNSGVEDELSGIRMVDRDLDERLRPLAAPKVSESDRIAERVRLITEIEKETLVKSVFRAVALGLERKDFSSFHQHLHTKAKARLTPEDIANDLRQFAKHRKVFVRLFKSADDAKINLMSSGKVDESTGGEQLELSGSYTGKTAAGLLKIPLFAMTQFRFKFLSENESWKLVEYYIYVQ